MYLCILTYYSRDSNNDPVLGQLMSVKEVLSKEGNQRYP